MIKMGEIPKQETLSRICYILNIPKEKLLETGDLSIWNVVDKIKDPERLPKVSEILGISSEDLKKSCDTADEDYYLNESMYKFKIIERLNYDEAYEDDKDIINTVAKYLGIDFDTKENALKGKKFIQYPNAKRINPFKMCKSEEEDIKSELLRYIREYDYFNMSIKNKILLKVAKILHNYIGDDLDIINNNIDEILLMYRCSGDKLILEEDSLAFGLISSICEILSSYHNCVNKIEEAERQGKKAKETAIQEKNRKKLFERLITRNIPQLLRGVNREINKVKCVYEKKEPLEENMNRNFGHRDYKKIETQICQLTEELLQLEEQRKQLAKQKRQLVKQMTQPVNKTFPNKGV
jgi:hypothetical protein